MDFESLKSAQMFGAADVVGSFTVMRFCKKEQRQRIASTVVDLFDEEVARTGERPDKDVFIARVKSELRKQEEANPTVGFIPFWIVQIFLGFIIQKILEWLVNHYNSVAPNKL